MPPEYVDTFRAAASLSPKRVEQVLRDGAWVLEVTQPGDQYQVLPPAEDFVDGRELSGQADGLPYLGSLRGDIEVVDAGSPRVGLEQRGQDFHDRGLARPVRAEQGENAAARHVEVHAAQHLQLLVRLLQTLHMDGLDLLCCHQTVPSSFPVSPPARLSIVFVRRSRSLSIHCLPE